MLIDFTDLVNRLRSCFRRKGREHKAKEKLRTSIDVADGAETKHDTHIAVVDDLAFPTWPPLSPKVILADRDGFKYALSKRKYRGPRGVFVDSPLYVLYRLYEAIMADEFISMRNELETFWWTRVPVNQIPDPGEAGDAERYAVLACIPSLIVESFNRRQDMGLRRDEPSAILSTEEQQYWMSTPKKYEKVPKWCAAVPRLETMLHIPNGGGVFPDLESLEDEYANAAFKSKNILMATPHIHFV